VVVLGAFTGLRSAEVCGLRPTDVDFMRGIVTPAQQWPGEPLKTDNSRKAIPIPAELALELSAAVQRWPGPAIVTDGRGGVAAPWAIDRAVRRVRVEAGLPEGFRFHDLRHWYASLLISSGGDVKVVQARLRHASAKTRTATCGPTPTTAPGRLRPPCCKPAPYASRPCRLVVGFPLTTRTRRELRDGSSFGQIPDIYRLLSPFPQVSGLLLARCRSRARTRADAVAAGSGRPPGCA
jgi:hypothetical protein